MKTIAKLKLTKMSRAQLERNEQNQLKGGARCCCCGCYAPGGSGSFDNYDANTAGGLYSPYGGMGGGF